MENSGYNWKIQIDPVKVMIMEVCEAHHIRLTPKEYDELVRDYKNKYILKVDVGSILQIAQNIEKRNS